MGLRDWSAKKILGIWTGWMAGLLVLLMAGVVLSPDGVVTITISGVGSSLLMRAAYGLFALVAACFPPAIITYAWYVRRMRAWGKSEEEFEAPGRLSEGAAADITARQRERVSMSREERVR